MQILFTGDGTRINSEKIAYYLNTDDTMVENNTCQRAKFYSNTCLFDHGNEFIIKKKMFSNNHKVILNHKVIITKMIDLKII